MDDGERKANKRSLRDPCALDFSYLSYSMLQSRLPLGNASSIVAALLSALQINAPFLTSSLRLTTGP